MENIEVGAAVKVLGPYLGEQGVVVKVWDQSYPTQYDVELVEGIILVNHNSLEVV